MYICIVNPAVFICTVKPTMHICTVNPAADLLADFVDGEQRGVGVDRSLQRAQLSHFGRVFPYKQKSLICLSIYVNNYIYTFRSYQKRIDKK